MIKLVLLRHGQSTWNLENVFTGWTDVSLSEKGVAEAIEAGRIMKEEGLEFDIAHTSLLERAINTLHLALVEMDQVWIPVVKHWRLNERHYGALQGLNKKETSDQHGKEHIDAVSGGVWTVNVGYGRERIANAIRDQLIKLPYFAGSAGSIPGIFEISFSENIAPGMDPAEPAK